MNQRPPQQQPQPPLPDEVPAAAAPLPPGLEGQISAAALAAAQGDPPPSRPKVQRVDLTRAVQAHDVMVSSVELREPTGDEVFRLGYPYSVIAPRSEGEQPEIRPIPGVVKEYIMALSSPPLPLAAVNELAPKEITDLSWAVVGFFW